MSTRLPDAHPDTPTLAALGDLLAALPADRAPAWGKMTAPQMLRHCATFNELCLGRVRVRGPIRWLAWLIGPMVLRRFLARSPRQAPRNLGTLPQLRADAAAAIDFDAERRRLAGTIAELEQLRDGHRHPLYGRMRAADVQSLARHHLAHHAHQFGLL